MYEKRAFLGAVGRGAGALFSRLGKGYKLFSHNAAKTVLPRELAKNYTALKTTQSAIGHGLFGGAMGAAAAEDGNRLQGFGKGFAGGALAGAGSRLISRGLYRNVKPSFMTHNMRRSMATDIGLGTAYGATMGYDEGGISGAMRGALRGGIAGAGAGALGAYHLSPHLKNMPKGFTRSALKQTTGMAGQLGAHMGIDHVLHKYGPLSDPNQRGMQQQAQKLTFIPSNY